MLYCLSSFLMVCFSSYGDRHREYCSMVMSSPEESVAFSAVVAVKWWWCVSFCNGEPFGTWNEVDCNGSSAKMKMWCFMICVVGDNQCENWNRTTHKCSGYRSKSQRVGEGPVGWARGSASILLWQYSRLWIMVLACLTLSGESTDFSPSALFLFPLCVPLCLCSSLSSCQQLGRKVSSHEPTVPTNPLRPAARRPRGQWEKKASTALASSALAGRRGLVWFCKDGVLDI